MKSRREKRESPAVPSSIHRHAGHFADIAGQHHRLAHLSRRQEGRFGYGVQQQPFQRTLPNLPHHQLPQKLAFISPSSLKKSAQCADLPFSRPTALMSHDGVEGVIHIRQGQCSPGWRPLGHRLFDQAPTNADLALCQNAAEIKCGEFCLPTVRLAEKLSQQRRLFRLLRRGSNTAHQLH